MAECKDPQVIIDSTLQFIRKSRSTDKAVSGTYNTDDYKNEVVSRLLKIRGEVQILHERKLKKQQEWLIASKEAELASEIRLIEKQASAALLPPVRKGAPLAADRPVGPVSLSATDAITSLSVQLECHLNALEHGGSIRNRMPTSLRESSVGAGAAGGGEGGGGGETIVASVALGNATVKCAKRIMAVSDQYIQFKKDAAILSIDSAVADMVGQKLQEHNDNDSNDSNDSNDNTTTDTKVGSSAASKMRKVRSSSNDSLDQTRIGERGRRERGEMSTSSSSSSYHQLSPSSSLSSSENQHEKVRICTVQEAEVMHSELEAMMLSSLDTVHHHFNRCSAAGRRIIASSSSNSSSNIERTAGKDSSFSSSSVDITTAFPASATITAEEELLVDLSTLQHMSRELQGVLDDAMSIARQNAKQAARIAVLTCVDFADEES